MRSSLTFYAFVTSFFIGITCSFAQNAQNGSRDGQPRTVLNGVVSAKDVGTIKGNAINKYGKPAKKALIELWKEDTKIAQTMTDKAGSYNFPYVLPGTYELRGILKRHVNVRIIKIVVQEEKEVVLDLSFKEKIITRIR